MKRKINLQLVGISFVAIIATLFIVVAVFYELFQKQIIEDLKIYGTVLENQQGIETGDYELNHYLDQLRITIINPDGTVIYDNRKDASLMENHSSRPEFKEAVNTGEGMDVRTSETLGKNTFYYALLLKSNNVLRVSKEADSVWSIFTNSIPVLILIVIFLMILSMLFANILTKRLVKPIEQVAENIERAEEIPVYRELIPIVETIQRQHQDILKNAIMRQEFTANVSHELKTPLTAILGYSELIENGMAEKNDIIRFATEIRNNSTRLLTLINDIIRLSEMDVSDMEVPMEKVNLYAVAQTCIDMLQIHAEKHDVTLKLEGSICYVTANREMMEEVLYNLCDNAIRYNNPGGTVLVRISREDNHVVVRVKDTGIGISQEHQERIFERFYRVDRSRSKRSGGTGLGLAIVKHIISKHHATLELESEKGVGTEIKIIF